MLIKAYQAQVDIDRFEPHFRDPQWEIWNAKSVVLIRERVAAENAFRSVMPNHSIEFGSRAAYEAAIDLATANVQS